MEQERPRVFIPEPIGSEGFNRLADNCTCVAPWQHADGNSRIQTEMPSDADAMIVRIFRVGAEELDTAPGLRVVAKHGVGIDNIDVAAATQRRIPVVYTPGVNANAVAEHTLALMLAVTRRLVPADDAVRQGWVAERTQFQGVELSGRTLGIIGLGRIGKRVALKASIGLGMRVLAYDPFVDPTDYPGPAQLVETLEKVAKQADYISLHVPLTDVTRRMVAAPLLSQLAPHCVLINTSRGAVVDEPAVAEALSQGRLGAAAIDVFEQEPLPEQHPLLQAPNTLLTPHIAGQSSAAMDAAARMAAAAVLDTLAGRRPNNVVNPEVFE